MTEGVSFREFARLDGCDPKLVREGIRKGRLHKLPDGKLDPAIAGTGWRKANRKSAEGKTAAAAPLDFEAARAFLTNVLNGNVSTRFDAETMKENALAGLRLLELLTRAERLVEIDDVASVVGQQFAVVRTKLLALPAEIAPRIARLKSPAEVQDALLGAITEAMEELVGYASAPNRREVKSRPSA